MAVAAAARAGPSGASSIRTYGVVAIIAVALTSRVPTGRFPLVARLLVLRGDEDHQVSGKERNIDRRYKCQPTLVAA